MRGTRNRRVMSRCLSVLSRGRRTAGTRDLGPQEKGETQLRYAFCSRASCGFFLLGVGKHAPFFDGGSGPWSASDLFHVLHNICDFCLQLWGRVQPLTYRLRQRQKQADGVFASVAGRLAAVGIGVQPCTGPHRSFLRAGSDLDRLVY